MSRMRSLWRGLRGRDDVEETMDEEFRAHLDLRADDLERGGLTRAQAERQARLEFGSVERYKDQSREARGLQTLDELRISWIDIKLSFRMFARYPALTMVASLAMAFGIWVGVTTFEIFRDMFYPNLPFAEGHRIVGIQLLDTEQGGYEGQILYDFSLWKEELRSIEDLGVFQLSRRNLAVGDDPGQPREIAEISASAFRITGVRALLGRTLIEDDERPDAPPVAVIGYELWRSAFASDPHIVGRTVSLGGLTTTVVGVMPKRYGFPLAYDLWKPLKLDANPPPPREGRGVRVFGRLAAGVSLEEAQAELSTLGASLSAEHPATHEHLRPQVVPHVKAVWGPAATGPAITLLVLMSSNLPPLVLLLLICGNVALLIYTRTATREADLVVRSALGASRSRLIVQLFAEALVLCGVAALIGLAAARFGLRRTYGVIELEVLQGERLPYWFDASISLSTIVYASLLTLLMAVFAGVLPALSITGGAATRLKSLAAGGGGPQLGRFWSVVIAAQIAVMVLFPAIAMVTRLQGRQIADRDLGFPSERYVAAQVEMDQSAISEAGYPATADADFRLRYAERLRTLENRLRGDPEVIGVAYSQTLPRTYHPWNQIEVQEGAAEPPDERGHRVGRTAVTLDYFDALQAGVTAGRPFHSGDLAGGRDAVIVDEAFVARILGGRNPIGRHVRYLADEAARTPRYDGPWYEIVGVVPDRGVQNGYGLGGIYHPAALEHIYPAYLIAHLRASPNDFAPNLREAAMAVDPALRLHNVIPLDDVVLPEVRFYAFWTWLAVGVSAVAFLLALTGIYSVTSFAVSRRTREIGVRVAIGARPHQVLAVILRRQLIQVGAGVLAGLVLVTGLVYTAEGPPALSTLGLLGYAAAMVVVCVLAAVTPVRRALRVQPTDALRAD